MFFPSKSNTSGEAAETSGDAGDNSAQATGSGEEKSEEEKKKEADAAASNRAEQLSKLKVPGNLPPVHFYFGSQTGTAEKFATVLDEEANMLGIEDSKVIDFNNFSEDTFAEQALVIVCVSTHYEGDPCDNTRNFFKWIKKTIREKKISFGGMSFAIFGLGDTSYEQYNEMGNYFDESFEKLGGKRLQPAGVGNAETFSTEDDFNKWKENLWSNII